MPQRSRNRRRSRHKKKSQFPSRRLTVTLVLVAVLILAAIAALYHRQPVATLATQSKHPRPQITTKQQPPPQPVIIDTTPKARFALVIDDMGYHQKVGDALLHLPLALSFAFLPHAPHTKSQLQLAKSRGRDILLHLPMEATDKKWDPGKGALFLAMNRQKIHRTILEDLAAVPGAIGINNHMGSRFTENETAMRDFLGVLKQQRLFFLDSLTSPNSVGLKIAAELNIPTLHRNVFLDNQQDKEIIKKQLTNLIFLARKQGIAIGIAHPHQATLDALRDFLRHPDKSVVMVSISSILGDQEPIAKRNVKQ